MSTGKGRKMKSDLEHVVAPELRALGFTGRFPVLKRVRDGYLDILEVQFDKYGGGFRLNLGVCPSDGATNFSGTRLSAEKVRVHDVMLRKSFFDPRILKNDRKAEAWFRFEEDNTEEVAKQLLPQLALVDVWFKTGVGLPDRTAPSRKPGVIDQFIKRLLRP